MAKVTQLPAKPRVLIVKASDVAPRPLDPVWPGVLWAGKPTLIAGDPGLGKSMLTCDIAARVTTGAPWPCSSERRPPASVLMLSAEDDPEDTIVPRLMAAGADLNRIAFVRGVSDPAEDGGRERWLSLDKHTEALATALNRDVRLIIIDPLSAYLGRDTDSHNEGDVRSVLSGLAALATEHRCSVLAVRHLRKSDSSSAQGKVIGSIAFTAAARAVYVVTRDPEDEDVRLVLCAKNNLAPDTAGYRYRVRAGDGEAPRVAWDAERESRTADEILGGSPDRSAARSDAERWIAQTLEAGPVPSARLRVLAEEAGHSWRTVERARARMGGVVIERGVIPGGGARGPWQWRLATPPCPTPPPPAMNSGGVGGGRMDKGFQPPNASQTATPSHTGSGVGSACPACDGEGCRHCGDTGRDPAKL